MVPFLHFAREPGFRDVPFTFDRGGRNAQHGGDFFDNASLLLVKVGKIFQSVIEGDHVGVANLGENEGNVEVNFAVGAALGGSMSPGMVDENLAHQAGSDSEKVRSILGIEGPLVEHPQIGFVDQRRALQGVAGAFPHQVVTSDVSQLLIDHWD